MPIQEFPRLTPEQLAALDGEPLTPVEGYEGPAQVTELEDGGLEVNFGEPEQAPLEDSTPHDANLAEVLDASYLNQLGRELVDAYTQDHDSTSEWRSIFTDGLELLGLKVEELTEPFPGAPSVVHPVLIESVVKFQAKSYAELFPSKGPVRTKVVGTRTKEREAQAKRVRDFMNYQIMTQMSEFGPELDRLLFYLPYAGSAFKKTFYDPILGRARSIFIRADDFVINYYATDLESAERYTHKFTMSENELRKHVTAGIFLEPKSIPSNPQQHDTEVDSAIDEIEGRTPPISTGIDNTYTLLEMHVNVDLPDEFADPAGIQRPYVVTIDIDSYKILAIRRNWKEGDSTFAKRVWFTHYPFVPGLGFYGYGYLHLIGGLAKTATGTMRNLLTAGIFSNFPAGYKSHGMRVVGGNDVLEPGEFAEINSPFQDLTKSIVPLPFKPPSETLMNLLTFVVEAAQKFADSTESVISESTNYGPVGTTMALIEASGKLFSAIHKRLHFAQKHDLALLAEINGEYLPDQYPYEVVGGQGQIFAKDFDGRVDVLPISDPNVPSQAQRISKAQVILTTAAQSPSEHDMREVILEMYNSVDIDEPERFLKKPPGQIPYQDPVTENVSMMRSQPASVKPDEDHGAHLAVHIPFLEDPAVQQNEPGMELMKAHIYWHVAENYKVRMQQAMGGTIPMAQPGQQIPVQQLNQIAVAAADVADGILAQAQQEAAEEEQTQAMADPEYQLAKEGLDIQREQNAMKHLEAMQELQRKIRKDAVDEVDSDLDRAMSLTIARLQARAKGGGSQ